MTVESARIATHLRTAILRGELAPGERIGQEDVAARHGVSRLPVREALRMLEAEGLVELRSNRSARVPCLDAHEVQTIYRMRERLEPLALAESLPYLTQDDLRRMAALQDRIEEGPDVETFLDLDREFHLLSYSACRTAQLNAVVLRLWNVTQHHRRTYMRLTGPDRRWVVDAEHRLIIDALVRGDAEDAEMHLAGHIRRTRLAFTS
ncbi:GntR family transcriptional regulator [Nonomuraea sp. NPDC050556]|uniref:GntR family transcriptional regulator n=1 Tax=Nonomuraea sp. NPDC050556 TaxID=3364369 RepID=UPI00379DC5B7